MGRDRRRRARGRVRHQRGRSHTLSLRPRGAPDLGPGRTGAHRALAVRRPFPDRRVHRFRRRQLSHHVQRRRHAAAGVAAGRARSGVRIRPRRARHRRNRYPRPRHPHGLPRQQPAH
nr:hypothetical protein [Massilia violaceinigra]